MRNITTIAPTSSTTPAEHRALLTELLQSRLADCIDLQSQLKQAHWNVKGPSFIALHKLFDEINEEVEEYVDDIAERGVQVGGLVRGTARVAAATTTLPEYPLDATSWEEHVQGVATALRAFGMLAREAIDECDRLHDPCTADLFTAIGRGIDKWLWFVEAHTQGRA